MKINGVMFKMLKRAQLEGTVNLVAETFLKNTYPPGNFFIGYFYHFVLAETPMSYC